MLRITYMCLCAASPATYLSFTSSLPILFNGSHVKRQRSAQQKVPSMLRPLSYNAPLYTSVRLRTLARELYRESTPRRCCGTRDFHPYPEPLLPRVGQKQPFPLLFSPICFSLGAFHTPVSEWHTETPVPKWSGLVSWFC
ncbi:hypothetical protein QBC32DRAFT_169040 [Pseudoneurospora amorphoporcata]|uniref:Uncharacterized protein n=1 Tax=Pseudoneurospora amorphoporcata TaxID=241081 RepID=A0AAN6NUC5_9PEZI|nr:hypothetical protein QBC32DRAFT_169040 [Pseudoneurospora amorphoporcata]